MNSKMLFIGIAALVIIALAGFLLTKNSTSNNSAATVPTPTAAMMSSDTPTASVSTTMMQEGTPMVSPSGTMGKVVVKELTVTGSNFKFAPATLTVKKGDTVTLIFKNSGGMHDLVIDELGVKTPVIPAGTDSTVQFVASKVGTFDYYCSVGNHRAMGMQGTITVTP